MSKAVIGFMISSLATVCPLVVEGVRTTYIPERTVVVSLGVYAHRQEAYKFLEAPLVAGRPTYAAAYALLGKEARSGWYVFKECATVGGKGIDWRTEFALCATPKEYGWGHARTFLVITSGEIWTKDLGHSELVVDVPVDMQRAGWKKVRSGAFRAFR
jgi:hypothetical protein